MNFFLKMECIPSLSNSDVIFNLNAENTVTIVDAPSLFILISGLKNAHVYTRSTWIPPQRSSSTGDIHDLWIQCDQPTSCLLVWDFLLSQFYCSLIFLPQNYTFLKKFISKSTNVLRVTWMNGCIQTKCFIHGDISTFIKTSVNLKYFLSCVERDVCFLYSFKHWHYFFNARYQLVVTVNWVVCIQAVVLLTNIKSFSSKYKWDFSACLSLKKFYLIIQIMYKKHLLQNTWLERNFYFNYKQFCLYSININLILYHLNYNMNKKICFIFCQNCTSNDMRTSIICIIN